MQSRSIRRVQVQESTCRLEQEKVETRGMAWTVVRAGVPILAGIPCGKRARPTALPYGPKDGARAKGWCWGGQSCPQPQESALPVNTTGSLGEMFRKRPGPSGCCKRDSETRWESESADPDDSVSSTRTWKCPEAGLGGVWISFQRQC